MTAPMEIRWYEHRVDLRSDINHKEAKNSRKERNAETIRTSLIAASRARE